MTTPLESLVPLANNFVEAKIKSDEHTKKYENARKALKSNFNACIALLPLPLLDLARILTSIQSYDKKVQKKVEEWIKKLETDNKYKIIVGGATIFLDDSLLKYFDSEYKKIKTNKEYLEFREAKKVYKQALKELKLKKKPVLEIETFLKTNKVAPIAIKKALYWCHYKI